MIMPPGSLPGINNLAMIPTTRPNRINPINDSIYSPPVPAHVLFPVCLGSAARGQEGHVWYQGARVEEETGAGRVSSFAVPEYRVTSHGTAAIVTPSEVCTSNAEFAQDVISSRLQRLMATRTLLSLVTSRLVPSSICIKVGAKPFRYTG